MPRRCRSFFQILGFRFKARGLRDTCHWQFVFQIYLEDKDWNSRFEIDSQPDTLIQPKAQVLLHMECDFSLHPIYENYFWRFQDYSSKSTMQPRCSQGSTWMPHSRQSLKDSKTALEVLGSLHYSATKSSGACQNRDHGVPDVALICMRYRMGHVPYLYIM